MWVGLIWWEVGLVGDLAGGGDEFVWWGTCVCLVGGEGDRSLLSFRWGAEGCELAESRGSSKGEGGFVVVCM